MAEKIWWRLVVSLIFHKFFGSMEEKQICFKRKIYDTMLRWKSERKGDTALLIQGARRVGKSTIAEEFARREYKSYLLIDFSKVSMEVMDFFNDISNYLFIRLQFIYQVELHERDSVIIFDEVQLPDRIMNRYLIYTKDYRREKGVEYLPVYMTMFL